MSWGRGARAAGPAPMPAGIEASEVATHQRAVPLRWFTGEDWCPLVWVIREPLNAEYKEIREKVGKSTQTTGHEIYADLAGVTSVGLHDAITGIEVGREVVWEGSITRSDVAEHPNYHRAEIVTSAGTAYFYWGRANQIVDTILLGPLAALDADQEHPGYAHQGLLIMKRCGFGQSPAAPSIRVRLRRAPRPEVGTFAVQNHVQGESLVAAALELITNPIWGAGAPAARVTAAQWEALSTEVMARAGRHSPTLDRERPLREVLREFFEYFDGWARIEGGKIVPGYFPHDGVVPEELTEISHHDIEGDPEIGAPALSKSANKVVVTYRDRTQKHRADMVRGSSRAAARALQRVMPESVNAQAIIDREQARHYAAERARTRAEGDSKGSFACRRPRAVLPGGARLQAGDNFNLDWLPYELDQVSRVTRIVEQYREARVTVHYLAERGMYPAPYVPPGDDQAVLGGTEPTVIEDARILELTTSLAGTPLGILIAVLAKRPPSVHQGSSAVAARDVVGFTLHDSPDGGSYAILGNQTTWAVRGTLRAGVGTGDGTIEITLDGDNLDADRLLAQNADGQADDRLLLVLGDEVMSIGAIAVSGADRDLSVLRARQGTLAGIGSIGDEVWLVYRDELVSYRHRQFIEDTTRFFKLQPYTYAQVMDLGDVTALEYEFRDRADELPVVVIDAPPAGMRTGLTYHLSGDISDVNGDLVSYQVQAARIVASVVDSEYTLISGPVPPAERGLFAWRTPVVWPQEGTWRIIVRAYDERSGYKETSSADITVAAGPAPGADDGVTPDAVSGVTLTGGLGMIVAEWTNPTNTPVDRVEIFIAPTSAKPANPSAVTVAPQAFYFLEGLAASTQRYMWFEVVGRNGRRSASSGPHNATTRAGVNLADIVPGMTLVEIVGALPGTANFDGRTVFLTTDKKLYRYNGTAAAWTTAIDGFDLVADSILAGALSAGAVTAYAVGTNLLITSSANIDDAVITGAKIANATIGTANVQDLAVTTLKIGDNAVTIPVTAFSASGASYGTSPTTIQSAAITSAGGKILIMGQFFNVTTNNTLLELTLWRDGTPIWTSPLYVNHVGPHVAIFVDQPGAGSYTYYFEAELGSGTASAENRLLYLLETKK